SRRHGRRGVDVLRKDEYTAVKRIKEAGDLLDRVEKLRRIEFAERAHALDHGDLGPSDAHELELSLRDSAGAVKHDWLLAIAGDFTGEPIQLFRECRG